VQGFGVGFHKGNGRKEFGIDAEQRAEKIYPQMLADYIPPALDPEIEARLIKFMDIRKEGFEDSNIS